MKWRHCLCQRQEPFRKGPRRTSTVNRTPAKGLQAQRRAETLDYDEARLLVEQDNCHTPWKAKRKNAYHDERREASDAAQAQERVEARQRDAAAGVPATAPGLGDPLDDWYERLGIRHAEIAAKNRHGK